MWKKRAVAGFVVSAVVAATVLASAGAAEASKTQCASGQGCAWNDPDYGGGLLYARSSGWANFAAAENDRASSIVNYTSRDVGWYADAGLSGDRYCQTPGNEQPNVGGFWDDRFSSMVVFTYNVC